MGPKLAESSKWAESPIPLLDTPPQVKAYKSNMLRLVHMAPYEIPPRLFVKMFESG